MITETEIILAFVLNLIILPTVGVFLIVFITNFKIKAVIKKIKDIAE